MQWGGVDALMIVALQTYLDSQRLQGATPFQELTLSL